MPSGRHKSRSMRRVSTRTPSGKSKLSYDKRKPSKAKCSECKAILPGVPRERPYKMQNMPKTQKRPERPYGGQLCSKCMREKIKAEVRE